LDQLVSLGENRKNHDNLTKLKANNFARNTNKDRLPLKRGSIHMKFSMKGQEKGDLLRQVTA
jgi:hypothetical protein